MKIDYDKSGMTIKLDEIPRLLYINETGHGCGQVYEDGKRIKKLQTVIINAQTDDANVHFLKYFIEYLDPQTHTAKVIGTDIMPDTIISIALKDSDACVKLLTVLKNIIEQGCINQKGMKAIQGIINSILKGE